MRTTFSIEDGLLKVASDLTRIVEETFLVKFGLEAIIDT